MAAAVKAPICAHDLNNPKQLRCCKMLSALATSCLKGG
jgi:hypothetical protein